jgi:hypothetical protein
MKIKNFLATIQKLLGNKYEAFKDVFATYKKSMHPNIDEFTAEMFLLFFGHKELAVCQFEIESYTQKKQILLKMREHVQPRHRERY